MTKEELTDLQRGDIVRHMHGTRTFVVTGNYDGRVTAVDTADITHPAEWKLVLKAEHTEKTP